MIRGFQLLFPEKQEHTCFVMGMIKNSWFHILPLGDISWFEFYLPTLRNTMPVPYS